MSISVAAAPLCSLDSPRTACVARPAVPERLDVMGGPSARDPLGRGTWLVDEENDEVLLVTPFGSSRRFPVGKWPRQLVVESTGRVFVSCRQTGRVDIIDPDFGIRAAQQTMESETGVRSGRRVPRKFDTPSLKSLAVTAPYFHDGAAHTLEQVVADNRDRMGTTSHLNELQRRALVAYLQTL